MEKIENEIIKFAYLDESEEFVRIKDKEVIIYSLLVLI
jgi:hypothetical protein